MPCPTAPLLAAIARNWTYGRSLARLGDRFPRSRCTLCTTCLCLSSSKRLTLKPANRDVCRRGINLSRHHAPNVAQQFWHRDWFFEPAVTTMVLGPVGADGGN